MSPGRRIESSSLIGTALAFALVAPMFGCSDPETGGPPAGLVTLDEARLAELKAELAGSDAPAPAPVEKPTADERAFANAEMVEAFVAQCREREQAEPPAPTEAGSSRSSAYGNIYTGQNAPELPPIPNDGIFRWVEGNPEFLDPNKISESSGSAIGGQLFETLLVTPPGNAPPVPGQAERFEVSEDGRTYTFHLREGLVWSDGEPITAETFRGSWLRGLDPETASKNAEQLWYIAGAEDYNNARTTDPNTVAIKAINERTLEVTLTNPTPYFPDLVTYIAYAPVPLHTIAEHGAQWTRVETMVVNGPFKIVEWLPRDRIVLEKNPRYWDAENVALEGSLIYSSDSESRNITLYQTGQVHWIKPLGSDRIREFLESGRSDLRIDEQMCTYYYVINTREPPFDDVRVRRAFNMAVNKERLTSHTLSSFQKPASNLLSDMFRATIGYIPVPGDPYDPDRARELLAEAGYPNGRGLPRVDLVYNTFESHRLIAEFVARNMHEALGVQLEVSNMEWKSLLKRVHAGEYRLARTAWCADYPDPFTFLGTFHSDSQNNYPGYFNPAYDALLARIRAETDRVERNALICAAEMALNRDVPIIPLYFYTRSYLLRPEVRGFEAQYSDQHYLKWISLEEAPTP